MLLSGKIAIVSGAGAGLGRSICGRFAANGARLVIGDKDQRAVDASLALAHELGAEAVGLRTDITVRAECEALVALARRTFGGVDVLVNDAYDGGDYHPFEEADLDRWQMTTSVNVFGTLSLTQAALRDLKASGAGRVVMICTHGVDLIQPSFGAYTTSKAALAHATQLLAAELGGHGVRVNAVFPGPIWSANLEGFLAQQAAQRNVATEEFFAEWTAKNVLNMRVLPDDVAESVVFFASDMARAITGQALYVNAGETFH